MIGGQGFPRFTGDEPCRQVDPEIYFPDTFNGVTRRTRKLMDGMCKSGCAMREQCLDWALKHEAEGYWAGTSPADRERMRRQKGIRMQRILIPITEVGLVA